MNKKTKKIVIAGVVIVLCAAIIVGGIQWAAGNKNNNLVAKVIPVMNIYTNYWDNDTSYGYVQSGYSQQVYGSSENIVQEFYVAEGDSVKIGDPLLSYDPTSLELEVERQELNLEAMDVRQERLEKELDNLKNTKPSDAESLSKIILKENEGIVTQNSSAEESGNSSAEESIEESSHEDTSIEESSEDSSSHEDTSKEESSEDSSSHEDTSKEESSEDSSSHEDTSKEESSEDSSSHEDTSKEESSEDSSSHEESSGEESSGEDQPEPPSPKTPIEVLTDQSLPYAGNGTEEDPYRYVITQNTKLMQSFYERWIGKETVYCVFERYEMDDPEGELRYAWYMTTEGLSVPEKLEIWDLGVYLTPLDEQSMILIIAQEKLPKNMALSMNLKFYIDKKAKATVVGANLLVELPVEEGYLNLQLEEGGVYNLYITPEETEVPEPIPDPGPMPEPGPTKAELQKQIREKETELRDLALSRKMAQLELEKTQKKLEDTVIRSTVNGKVISVQPEGAMVGQPLVTVTGDEGFYVSGVMSEFNLEQIKIGQKVTGMSWMNGETYEGTITEIGQIPTSPQGWSSSDNMNASYYPFTVYFDDYSALQEGQGIELSLSQDVSMTEDTFCIPKMYIREEKGQSYVLADNNGVLEKRIVTLGRSLSGGYYMEILDGLTLEDSIAFPYGKEAKEGVKTQPADDGLIM